MGSVEFSAPHPLIGWLGFISYDIGRTLEEIPGKAADELRWPLLRWTLYRHYLLHDGAAGRWRAVGLEGSGGKMRELLRAAERHTLSAGTGRGRIVEMTAEQAFRERVEQVRAYIAAGDIYQANLAQRCEREKHVRYIRLWIHHRQTNPTCGLSEDAPRWLMKQCSRPHERGLNANGMREHRCPRDAPIRRRHARAGKLDPVPALPQPRDIGHWVVCLRCCAGCIPHPQRHLSAMPCRHVPVRNHWQLHDVPVRVHDVHTRVDKSR